jgi:penicillin amidase
MIHLEAPGLDVSGVSLPGLPLVIIGHNQRIAWGMTNTAPDVQDLYAETFNFRDPKKYLHHGEWIAGEEREESIKVRKERDYRLTVKVTRHGPVVAHDNDRDLALRWTALEPHALRFPFLKIDRAGNWQEFTGALRDFTGPMQNFVYADSDGNIGYYAAGWVPVRKQGDGTVPSPGDTDDHDWTGFIPFEQLPHAYNPASGIIATANGRVVPDDYPYLITHKWEAPYRTAHIFELLRAGSTFAVADMLRVQTDIHSCEDEWLKKQLLAAAVEHNPEGSDARYALSLVRDWDGEARWDSAATLVLEVARRALLERLLRPRLGDDLSGYHWPMSTSFLENVFNNRWPRWLPPGDADFSATLVGSLEEGVRRIPQLVGSRDRGAWKWGQTIPLTFRHHLSGGLPLLGRLLDTGPYPQSGTQTTVKQTTPSVGPSMRMVVDFSNLDDSVENLTLGESGQVLNPYYRDQFQAWYTGHSFPMLFSDAAVDAGTAHRLVLEPGTPP